MIEKLEALSAKVKTKLQSSKTEEATKTSFILPFFSLLGYDVSDPDEVIPEFVADVGVKKGEKVDYCIVRDGEPIIIVEAKHHEENLDKHSGQLYRYYSVTNAKFAILTNGVEYRFFADFEQTNKMDSNPFFVFNILDYDEQDINALKNFRKNSFDVFAVSNAAEEMRYESQVKAVVKRLIESPDDDFIRYVLSSFHNGKKTQQLVDKVRPIVKNAIDFVINEAITERVMEALNNTTPPEIIAEPEPEKETTSTINTTKEELEAFFTIKHILRSVVPWNKLHYRDSKHYFAVLYDDKNYKWICRLRVEKANKYIVLPDGTPHGKACPLNGISGLFDYADEIIASAQRFTEDEK